MNGFDTCDGRLTLVGRLHLEPVAHAGVFDRKHRDPMFFSSLGGDMPT